MKKNLERMTTSDYAEARSISPQAVCKAIKKGHRLPGVETWEIVGKNTYLFYVNLEQLKKFVNSKKQNTLQVK